MIVVTDHKPLCKLLGNRSLDQIENPRLLRLKEKTLRWRFTVKHRPGKEHHFADAASRNLMEEAELDNEHDIESENCFMTYLHAVIGDDEDADEDEMETYVNAVIRRRVDEMKIKAVTWERIKSEMKEDADMRELMDIVL